MESLMLSVGSTQVHLLGDGIVAPVKGCRRTTGNVIEKSSELFPLQSGMQLRQEEIAVVLQGTPDEIDDWLRMIEALFSRIALGERAVIYIQPAEGLDIYQSSVLGGKLVLLGNGTSDMKRGGMGVRLDLVRENYWEGSEVDIPLTNPHGVDVIDGLLLYNQYHENGSKYNYALIDGADIVGEIPAPVTIKIKNDDTTFLDRLGRILVGQSTVAALQPGDTWIEGALGSSSLNYGSIGDADASNAAYGLIQWSGVGAYEIIKFQIERLRAARFAGKLVKPVVRMHDYYTTDDYWIRFKVKQGDAIERTRWQKIETYKRMIVLPAVHVPPKDLQTSQMADVWVSIEMQRKSVGPHQFTIDDIDLIPVDGYREYDELGSYGLYYGETLVDELSNDLLYSYNFVTFERLLSHRAIGKGIWVVPGLDQMIVVKYAGNSNECEPNHIIHLSMSYRPRRINL